jgi:hypothetical protein
MTFEIVPGNALGCRTNAHRHGWDGSICDEAAEWACGIEADFRSKYCQGDIPRCFHLHLFDEEDPHLVIPDSGVGWILGRSPEAFDDQLLLIWAPRAEEPRGLISGRPAGSIMAGAYRIEGVERIEQRNHIEWRIHPYEDGWVYLGGLDLQAPRFIHLGGPYIKQVEATALPDMFEAGREAGADLNEVWTEAERDRLEHFCDGLKEWMGIAEERAEKLMGVPRRPIPDDRSPRTNQTREHEDDPGLRTRVIPSPPKAPRPEPPESFPLVEASRQEAISQTYGADTLAEILAADLCRPLLILRGAPGVGKSRLALELIDDPGRQRTLIVPVSSTWRGPEDLLGRVNRARQQHEPTVFTNFLRAAHLAWLEGDYSTRVVVFEQLDLAQAENWLSDILLRIRYPADRIRDRTIHFEGDSARGWEGPARTKLFISPAVRFVATVDDPIRPGLFTPRLLDSAAVVPLSMKPAKALELGEVELDAPQIEAITELDRSAREFHTPFSLTDAHGLATLLKAKEELGLEDWRALDIILAQGMVSRLEFAANGELGEEVRGTLVAWSQANEEQLPTSCARLRHWLHEESLAEATSV